MTRPRMCWEPIDADMTGEKVSLVVTIVDDHKFSVGAKQTIECDFVMTHHLVAFHAWEVKSVENNRVTLLAGPDSSAVPIPDPDSSDMCKVAEICAGMGGTSAGAMRAGLLPVLAMDLTSLACEALRRNEHPCVLQGDILILADVGKFHAAYLASRYGLLAGFPCQPFGTLGRHLAFDDPRSLVFFAVLNVAFLVQSSFLLLECVVGAGGHSVVLQTIRDFCQARGFKFLPVILHLHHVVPNYRTRWWCLIVPSWIPDFSLTDLPVLADLDCLRRVFDPWPLWPLQEEIQLQLTSEELAAFQNPALCTSSRLVQKTGKCPTLLHSLGNQLFSCPCGCRGPLSHALLSGQGLHGVLVFSEQAGIGQRHLHPGEASCLLGLPVDNDHGADMRAALCLLGQIASPFQAEWVLIHLMAALGVINASTCRNQFVLGIRAHLESHRRHWVTGDMCTPGHIHLCYVDGTAIDFAITGPTTVLDLLLAEYRLSGIEVSWKVMAAGLQLDCTCLIRNEVLHLLPDLGCGPLGSSGLDAWTMHEQGLQILDHAGLLASQFLTPCFLAHLLSLDSQSALVLARSCLSVGLACHGLLLVDHHWLYVAFSVQSDVLLVHWADGLNSCSPSAVWTLAWIVQNALDLSAVDFRSVTQIVQHGGTHCGAIALLHLTAHLGLPCILTETAALALHNSLISSPMTGALGFGPLGEQAVLSWLENFLPSKGVDPSQALDRARLALKKLGLAALQTAISQKDPWRALKAAGGNLGKPFQWVTYPELQAHIAQREQHKFGTKQDKPKKPAKRGGGVVTLSPDTLQLYPTTFVDDHDDPVAPITLPEVVANACGVCIVTVDQAKELASADTNLSTGSLAVVSIGEVPLDSCACVSHLRWPALYTPTKEPVLVMGSLVNLGDSPVSLATVADAPEVATIVTEVIRLTAFRDMFDRDWASFTQGPVKLLLSLLPALQPCQLEGCSGHCKFFHAAIDEDISQPVLDVWSWKWSSLANKPVPVAQADMFSVFVRIPQSALKDVLALSGWHGVFVEPRPPSKQGPHPNYVVTWLPKSFTLPQALELKRKHDVVIGVARMQKKLGLRALTKHETMLQGIVYPGKALQVCAVTAVYEVGPLPHGLSHSQVDQLLQAWRWLAKPLRPQRSCAEGQYWDIGTSTMPPASILHTAEGSVTVSLKQDRAVSPPLAPQIHASTRTKKHMQTKSSGAASSSSTTADPWVLSDPWQGYTPTMPPKSSGDGEQEVVFTDGSSADSKKPQKSIDALEARLMEHLDHRLSALPPPGLAKMEEDHVPVAVQSELTELRAQQEKFHSWFKDVGVRFSGLDQSLGQQQAKLEELHAGLQHQNLITAQLQGDMQTLQASLKSDMEACLENQTTRLEAILEKRHKTS
eukprot:Skav223016  [mRNA]  locus=scaffold1422:105003:109151:- [translate_table: standard]